MHAHGTVLNGVSQRGRGRRGVIMHQYRVVANGGGGRVMRTLRCQMEMGNVGGRGTEGRRRGGGGFLSCMAAVVRPSNLASLQHRTGARRQITDQVGGVGEGGDQEAFQSVRVCEFVWICVFVFACAYACACA